MRIYNINQTNNHALVLEPITRTCNKINERNYCRSNTFTLIAWIAYCIRIHDFRL